MSADLSNAVEAAWEARDTLNPQTKGAAREAVEAALEGLDSGKFRVAEKLGKDWVVHQWLKKAVLLSFRLADMAPMPGAPGGTHWFDKVPLKCAGWDDARFRKALVHAVEQERLPYKRIEDALIRQRRAKERFLASAVAARPATGRALRDTLGRDEHRAIAEEMARFL